MTTRPANPSESAPLTEEETRVFRILNHPALIPILRTRLASQPTLSLTYERLIENSNAASECNSLWTILNGIFTPRGEQPNPVENFPSQLYPFLHAVSETRNTRCRVLFHKLYYTLNLSAIAPDLLARGSNAITLVRGNNICQNCGYGGHFPTECAMWQCRHCRQVAPGHQPENCLFTSSDPNRRILRPSTTFPPNPQRQATAPSSVPTFAVPVPPPQNRRPLVDRIQAATDHSDSNDSDEENQSPPRLIPQVNGYAASISSNASNSPPPAHLPTRPRLVIEPSTADPSPRLPTRPIQDFTAAPSGGQQTTLNGRTATTADESQYNTSDYIDERANMDLDITHPPVQNNEQGEILEAATTLAQGFRRARGMNAGR